MIPEITEKTVIKVVAGKYKVPLTIIPQDGRLFLKFGFNRILIEEVKTLEGPKWHGFDDKPRKIWSVANSEHNRFRLAFWARQDSDIGWANPYARYDIDLLELDFKRPLYDHQKLMVQHVMTRKQCLLACEMGTGKTLAAIEVMERIGLDNGYQQAWYVGPKSGVKAVGLELLKWEATIHPRMFTYEALVRELLDWDAGILPPKIVIYDESSKIKTPTAQRSQASMHLATSMREAWGDDCFIVEMSGAPAPRVPTDWWHQCQIACPGFLKEGNIHKFKHRLCIIEQREAAAGGVYPHIVTWLDDRHKCAECGLLRLEEIHRDVHNLKHHQFKNSVNEVEKLFARMKGLVLVQFKKDCLDLPEQLFEVVNIKPSVDMLRASKLITKTSRRALEALVRLRELSDGFQYESVPTGETEECPTCHGVGTIKVPMLPEQEEFDVIDPTEPQNITQEMIEKEVMCDHCGGKKVIKKYKRSTQEVGTPKDAQLAIDLEDHEDVGRFIVWGGFTATIDRLIQICHQYGWATLRVDGRGYEGRGPQDEILDADELLMAMDASHPKRKEFAEAYPKLCFVGHPKAGGMALTLTASPTMAFFSNDFSGEARFQASERHHRAGMDANRAAKIRDYIHLPTDQLVLDNLLKKKKLQDMAMGELNTVINKALEGVRDE
jgi:hypothetical protein